MHTFLNYRKYKLKLYTLKRYAHKWQEKYMLTRGKKIYANKW